MKEGLQHFRTLAFKDPLKEAQMGKFYFIGLGHISFETHLIDG
jgi:hypothetical protein